MKRWWRKGEFEAEMSEELRDHLERQTAANIAAGMGPEEARRQASLQLGGIERVKESCQEERPGFWLETLWADVRYGMRMLRRNPGFSAVAVLTLALGIGANAAIFGLVDSTLLRAMPFGQPERLVHIWTTDSAGDLHTPVPEQYLAVRKYGGAFDQVAGMGWVENFYGSDASGWQNLPGLVVSSNWLPTLGVQPLLGRNFLDEEQNPGRDAVVILSYSCWHARFHGDPHLIGKRMVLNRRPVTVVGVMPQTLGPYYRDYEIFAPLVLQSYEKSGYLREGFARVQIVARLKRGVPLDKARLEAQGIGDALRGPAAPTDRSGHLVVEQFLTELQNSGPTLQNARRGLLMMGVAAGLVLLMACANVASLLLARGVKREKEFNVRLALGCSRARMVRQLLTESTLLFLCGGMLGLIAARWAQEIIGKMASGIVSSSTTLEVDARVFGAGLAVSLLTAAAFGIVPALHASRVNLNDGLKDTAGKAASGSRSRGARNLLVVSQIALGMVLLVGFGLLFRSFLHVETSALGFDARNLVTTTVTLPAAPYADAASRARLMREAVERTRAIPGVESVGIADSLPMEGADSAEFRIERPSRQSAPAQEETWFLSVSPEYFSALRIPMLRGRTFDRGDTQGQPVAVVNQTFAKTYFPGRNAVGYHVAFADAPAKWIEIVGVVSDFRQRNPEEDPRPLLYFPIEQTLPRQHWSLAIRVQGGRDMGTVASEVAKWLRPLDPQLYWEIGTMDQHIHDSESLTLRRPIIALLGSIGGLAIVLVIVGVLGVTSYTVAERTREIGIRVVLGAARANVATLVLRESLRVAFAGLAVGTIGAFVLASFFPTAGIGWSGSGIFLYHVSRTDTLTYTTGAVLLMGIVLVASWMPARRAMRVDPMVALRYE
jgi:predicted permease